MMQTSRINKATQSNAFSNILWEAFSFIGQALNILLLSNAMYDKKYLKNTN